MSPETLSDSRSDDSTFDESKSNIKDCKEISSETEASQRYRGHEAKNLVASI